MPATRILVSLTLLLFLLPVGACQDKPPVELPPLSFKQYLPIHMAVADIQVVEEYKSPQQLPNVDHLIPYSPTEAMQIWAEQRLRAVGSQNKLEIIVKEGSVKVYQLPSEQHWSSLFTGMPDKRYEAVLDVEVRVYEPNAAMSNASVRVNAKRSIIINDSATVLERDAAFRQLINELMTMINAQLEKNMFQYMANYISFSSNP